MSEMLTDRDNDCADIDNESQDFFDGTGTDLDGNAYISRFEGSRESMRRELSNYLDTMREANDSYGNKLISIPGNFDDVSNAMNRGKH